MSAYETARRVAGVLAAARSRQEAAAALAGCDLDTLVYTTLHAGLGWPRRPGDPDAIRADLIGHVAARVEQQGDLFEAAAG